MMTPPPEPRTTAGRAYLEKLERDDAGMQKLSSGRFHLGAITADARTAVIAIEAEAAGSPNGSEDAPLREALDLIEALLSTGGPAPGTRKEARQFVQQHRAALTATPAPYWGSEEHAAFTAEGATPAPAPLDVEALVDIIEQAIFETDTGLAAALLASERILTARQNEATLPAPDHDCLMPSACGVTGFYCANSRPAPTPLDVTADTLNDILIELDPTFDLPFHAALAEAIAEALTARLTARAAATEDTE